MCANMDGSKVLRAYIHAQKLSAIMTLGGLGIGKSIQTKELAPKIVAADLDIHLDRIAENGYWRLIRSE